MENKQVKRYFGVENAGGFMLYDTNDILFGILQYYATTNPNEKDKNHETYITAKKLAENKKDISEQLGITPRTLMVQVDKLVDFGLMEPFDFIPDKKGKLLPSKYGFTKKDEFYQLIDRELLIYVCDTRTKNTLRAFVYLTNKYIWKKNYEFTNKELLSVMGYSESYCSSGNGNRMMTNILASLAREGLIEYKTVKITEYDNVGRATVTEKKVLLHVAMKMDDLRFV